jgi:hypothetical protein
MRSASKLVRPFPEWASKHLVSVPYGESGFVRVEPLEVSEAEAALHNLWRPGERRFDWAWHDVWVEKSVENLEGMRRMVRHYQRYMRVPGRQACWSRSWARAELRERRW